jgi:hypothetical protein
MRTRFTAHITGVSTDADGQLTVWCHDAMQAHYRSRTPRLRWPASPLIRAGAALVHVAGRVGAPVAGEDGGAHLDLRAAAWCAPSRANGCPARAGKDPTPQRANLLALRPDDLPPMATLNSGSGPVRHSRIWTRR